MTGTWLSHVAQRSYAATPTTSSCCPPWPTCSTSHVRACRLACARMLRVCRTIAAAFVDELAGDCTATLRATQFR